MSTNTSYIIEGRKDIDSARYLISPKNPIDPLEIRWQCYNGLSILVSEAKPFVVQPEFNFLDDSLKTNINKLLKRKAQNENINDDELFPIYLTIYRYFIYLKIYTQVELDLPTQVFDFLETTKIIFDKFDTNQKTELTNVSLFSPIYVARNLLHSDSAIAQREFIKSFQEAKTFNTAWDSEYKLQLSKINELKNNIEKLKSEYNFVGLVDGFKNIKNQKKQESQNSYCGTIITGTFLILIPIAVALLASFGNKIENGNYIAALAWFIPTLTIEILTLYFFRVFLHQFKSIQAQLIQIDLRISLCQFIESYITYKSQNSIEKDDALAKFESLVFSGIVTEAGSIPSTFEGLEQVASILKSFGGGKS